MFSDETPDVGYAMNGLPGTDTHIAILTSEDVICKM